MALGRGTLTAIELNLNHPRSLWCNTQPRGWYPPQSDTAPCRDPWGGEEPGSYLRRIPYTRYHVVLLAVYRKRYTAPATQAAAGAPTTVAPLAPAIVIAPNV